MRTWRGSVMDVRTGKPVRRRQKRIIARDLAKTLTDPKYRPLFDRIKSLNERLGPPMDPKAPQKIGPQFSDGTQLPA